MSHSRPIYDVHENTSGKYTARLVDESSVAIDSTIVETIQLTLYDTKTETIINNRDAQDVLNTNGVTIDCDGTLTWLWEANDMPLITTTKSEEIHTAVFRVVWGSGLNQLFHEISFRVHEVNIPTDI